MNWNSGFHFYSQSLLTRLFQFLTEITSVFSLVLLLSDFHLPKLFSPLRALNLILWLIFTPQARRVDRTRVSLDPYLQRGQERESGCLSQRQIPPGWEITHTCIHEHMNIKIYIHVWFWEEFWCYLICHLFIHLNYLNCISTKLEKNYLLYSRCKCNKTISSLQKFILSRA